MPWRASCPRRRKVTACCVARLLADAGRPNWSAICPSCWPSSRFPTPVAQGAHHQHHRTLLRQRAVRGPNHLLHLPEIQSGMENPHPPAIYTSSLTSPRFVLHLRLFPGGCRIRLSVKPKRAKRRHKASVGSADQASARKGCRCWAQVSDVANRSVSRPLGGTT